MAKLSVSAVSARLCTNVTTTLLTTIEFYKVAYIINPENCLLLASVPTSPSYNSGPKKVYVCIAFPFPFRAKKHKRNTFGTECISCTIFKVFMISAGIYTRLFEMINNAGK